MQGKLNIFHLKKKKKKKKPNLSSKQNNPKLIYKKHPTIF